MDTQQDQERELPQFDQGSGAGDLAARLRARQEASDAEAEARAQEPLRAARATKARARAFTALRWTAGGAMSIGALVLFAMAGAQAQADDDEVRLAAQPLAAAQERIDAAEASSEALPDTPTAQRWLAQANAAGLSVAESQSVYLAETAPLTLDGVPSVDPKPKPGTRPEPYTDEQRWTMAQQMREDRVSGLARALTPHFDVSARDLDGVEATADWQLALPGDPATGLRSGGSWSFLEARLVDRDGLVSGVWELRSASGQLLAWAVADYDPMTKTFAEPAVSAASTTGGPGA